MANKEKKVKEKKQKSNSFFKEMKAELKKVVWPTPKELLNNTVAVIGFVLIIAVIVFILDVCFDNLNKYGITKLEEGIQSSLNKDSDEEDSETENSEEDSESSEIEDSIEDESEESNETEEIESDN